jgi:hypothetical protein
MNGLPRSVKREVQERLWGRADALDWQSLTVIERAKQYALWVSDPDIGTVLAAYMDARRVHPYIKDTLMKPYARARVSDVGRPLEALNIPSDVVIVDRYERPHGVVIADRGVVCWGLADDWKLVLMAAHERAFARRTPIAGVVLLPPLSRFIQRGARSVVEDAARKLGVGAVAWHDPHDQLSDLMSVKLTAVSA